MSDFLNGLKRTDMCGSLRSGDIGRQVTIMGWVVRRRDLGNLIFVQIRDKTGVVQAVFDSSETEKALFDKAFSCDCVSFAPASVLSSPSAASSGRAWATT